jgi:16S rRNA (adenine1518-N6/adenine1519-N6)-dimethyltransferase
MSRAWEDPRRVLSRHGLLPKRSYSQNFLVSERAIRSIVEACELRPEGSVVELGAGCGTLTQALAAACSRVFAVERDPDMLRVLAAECDPARVQVVAGDAKQIALDAFRSEAAPRVTVAGNLPYAITGAILRNLVAQHDRVACAVLMVQREVRDRLVASADGADYGALTVFTAQVFSIETVLHLPKTAFHPPPKVTSSVIRLRPLATPRAQPSAAFDSVVRAAFQARRKTLRNALVQALGPTLADAALSAAAIDGKRRGETLSIEEFGALAQALEAQQLLAAVE